MFERGLGGTRQVAILSLVQIFGLQVIADFTRHPAMSGKISGGGPFLFVREMQNGRVPWQTVPSAFRICRRASYSY
jgi:hypothetical protein